MLGVNNSGGHHIIDSSTQRLKPSNCISFKNKCIQQVNTTSKYILHEHTEEKCKFHQQAQYSHKNVSNLTVFSKWKDFTQVKLRLRGMFTGSSHILSSDFICMVKQKKKSRFISMSCLLFVKMTASYLRQPTYLWMVFYLFCTGYLILCDISCANLYQKFPQ